MSETKLRVQNLGYPRIGENRELKRALEAFWRGDKDIEHLRQAAKALREKHWKLQNELGVDLIPSNDFSYYDQVLDMSCLLGNVPERFDWDRGSLVSEELYFTMARGLSGKIGSSQNESSCCGSSGQACEMTKWFDTNYHYLVPEFSASTSFSISSQKVFDEYLEAKALGIETVPVLLGPLTYLSLGKCQDERFDRYDLWENLLSTYKDIVSQLVEIGVTQLRFDEPALSTDLSSRERSLIKKCYDSIASDFPDLTLQVASYFGQLGDNLETLLILPVDIIHLDLIANETILEDVLTKLVGSETVLSLGLVSGRNIWKSDLAALSKVVESAVEFLGEERVIVSPSCSLQHVPVSLANEVELDGELKSWLAFANEKLVELASLRECAENNYTLTAALKENRKAIASRLESPRCQNAGVRERLSQVDEEMYSRASEFTHRQKLQKNKLNLPTFPTTTIGSFPQTKAVREARAKFRSGQWSEREYMTFLKLKTSDCIKQQEEIGLDVLVHGEFERNDMVEYFGEQLEGFLFTKFGWVQSYGSRCVKPPVIYGDVYRENAMTVKWAEYAQSLTDKPVKGMLTGPVTILQWSFVRDDQPRSETANQIALAIRDEVRDLERAGVNIIQIDEAALREGLPLRRSQWNEYLHWAVRAFCLTSSGVQDETQIHTHMCYSEFNDILKAIVSMDADVITIESARSGDDLLRGLERSAYPNEIGPGVYDIHSPRVAESAEMVELLETWRTVFETDQLWVNPDCGLKTRGWPEVISSLTHMVEAAKLLRAQVEEISEKKECAAL